MASLLCTIFILSLKYRFHDPAVAAEYIMKVFVEANEKKVEETIREAARGRKFASAT